LTVTLTTNALITKIDQLCVGGGSDSRTLQPHHWRKKGAVKTVNTATETRSGTPGNKVMLSARVGHHRVILTESQLRDTVASYLARGQQMPTPTDLDGGDPVEPLHVIVEEWLYGNVQGWTDNTDVVHLEKYHHHATQWIHQYFGRTAGGVEQQPHRVNRDRTAL
jgi:hypothetical protein